MPFNQNEIITRAQALGFESHGGWCFGISHMMMQAVMAGDLDSLLSRFQLMRDIPVGIFKEIVEKRIANALKNKDRQCLETYHNLYAFLSGCTLYQSPEEYHKNLYPSKKGYFTQEEIPAMPLVQPIALDKEGKSIYRAFENVGIYNDSELSLYLKSLRLHLGSNALHLILSSGNHAIYLHFDPIKQNWLLSDPNLLPGNLYPIDEEDNLADALKKALFGKECTLIETIIYSQEDKRASLEEGLQALQQDSKWQAIHQLERAHINQENQYNITLFYLACQKGDISLVRRLLENKLYFKQINQAESKGITPFAIACQSGHYQIAELLLNSELCQEQINQISDDGATPLWIACQNGHDDVVKLLLTNALCQKQIDQIGNLGQTPFFKACQHGYTQVVELLLNNVLFQEQINQTNNDGATPLLIACQNGHYDVVELLLNNALCQQQVNQACNSGETPFFMACQNGHTQVVKLLLNHALFQTQINQARNDGITPLWMACQEGHTDIVELLLTDDKARSQLYQNDNRGISPLMIASFKGHHKIAELLLKHLDKEAINNRYQSKTAFDLAIQGNNLSVIETFLQKALLTKIEITYPGLSLLLPHLKELQKRAIDKPELQALFDKLWSMTLRALSDKTPLSDIDNNLQLILAAISENPLIESLNLEDLSQEILQNLDLCEDSNATIFWQACKRGDTRLVFQLLQKPNIHPLLNKADKVLQFTPFIVACYQGQIEIVKLFLENGLDQINLTNDSGVTGFLIACQEGHFNIVSLLLENKLSQMQINLSHQSGCTAFCIACQKGHYKIVELLLNNKRCQAQINQARNDGITPLWIASQKNHIDVMKLLLNSGLCQKQINQKNCYGVTPFAIACQEGNIEIVQLLLADDRTKAQVYQSDNRGVSPLMIASFKGHHKIVELLLKHLDKDSINNTYQGKTAFDLAIQGNKISVIECFLQQAVFKGLAIEDPKLTSIIEKLKAIHQIVDTKDSDVITQKINQLSQRLTLGFSLISFEQDLETSLLLLKKQQAIQIYSAGITQFNLFLPQAKINDDIEETKEKTPFC